MSIKVNKTTNQEAVEHDKIHLNRFVLNQPLTDNAKVSLSLRTYLFGQDSEGKVVFNKESRWDNDYTDFEGYAIQMYMEKTGATLSEAVTEYQRALLESNNANILESVAYFHRGIALLYDHDNDAGAEVQ